MTMEMQVCPSCGEESPTRFRLCGYCGTQLTAALPPQEERKVVTVFFSDLKGSTNLGEALDPESLREVMTRYFDAMTRVLHRHGATIEKFIGDAIMAVFGLPKLHEDDALRAVRAAKEAQTVLVQLNDELERTYGVRLTNRTGVNTGEVVAGNPTAGQRLVVGDAVNTAARLEQAAPENEILIGALTYRLVRGAVEVEEVAPLELKGKAERVPAYRLLAVSDATEGFERRHDAPMVGREQEMTVLRDAYRRSVDEQACRMATVIADAGVGKSRLVLEFTASLAAEANVVHGRCLPYGEGITFWPLVEAAREAALIGPEDPPATALDKLAALTGDEAVTARLASAIGLSGDQFPVAETFWAARHLLETLGRERPVLVVIDDIHWAEATFLELIGHLVESVEGASVLLLCTSRPDLLEHRPDWALDADSRRIVLQPLTDADAARIVSGLLGEAGIAGDVQERIVRASEGNPLFVEQLLSMMIDTGALHFSAGHWERVGDLADLDVPPSIHALLAARLDLLAREERAVIEPASVIGVIFPQAAVAALAPEPVRPAVPTHLASMTRKQLIRPTESPASDDIGYRFAHILIRDAAYGGLLKRARATLHERFADWADEVNRRQGRPQEFEEILGYHLEQAHRYLADLGPLDDHALSLGSRASEKLASAGRRAMMRGDMPAAVNLLGRSAATLPTHGAERARLLPNLAESLMEIGEFDQALSVLTEATGLAVALGDERLGGESAMIRLLVERNEGESPDWSTRVGAEVERVLPVFERTGDHAGLALAWRVRYALLGTAGRYGQAAEAAEAVIEHALLAGDERLRARGAAGYAVSALYGPVQVPEAIAHCERLAEQSKDDRRTEALIRSALAQLYAMRGEFDHARDCYRDARAALEELGSGILAAATSTDSGRVELLAGDLDAARRELERDYLRLGELGETFLRATVGGLLGRVAYAEGHLDEASRLTHEVEAASAADDADAQALWRGVRACTLARRAEFAEARRLAAEAVEIRRLTDSPTLQAEALADLAEVELLAGEADAAAAALGEAVGLYARKGDTISPAKLAGRSWVGLTSSP